MKIETMHMYRDLNCTLSTEHTQHTLESLSIDSFSHECVLHQRYGQLPQGSLFINIRHESSS